MSELNLDQIIDRLNAEFTGDSRKIVFWYDDNADFEEDMQEIKLNNAKVHFLRKDNQFYTKYLLEREDKTSNYLIYAPFPKPDVRDNHLEDTLLYSQRFYADRASLLCSDLGISERYKPVIEKHIKFFGSKERTKRFYDLEIEGFNERTILTGLICAVCKTNICSFEEAVRVIIAKGELKENAYLREMDKYNLTKAFWKLCEQQFGYIDTEPTLERLLVTMFVTYTGKYIRAELPTGWKTFVSVKPGNIIAFLDSLMNSILYSEKYDCISDYIASGLNASAVFAEIKPDDLINCGTFRVIDEIIIKWLTERLTAEDTGASLNGQTIPQVCDSRMKLHFGKRNETCYLMLKSAYNIICCNAFSCPDGFANIAENYKKHDYAIDQEYRHFYYEYDKLENTDSFEKLRELTENIYTNEYLALQLPKWNEGLMKPNSFNKLPLQINFYNRFVKPALEKERTVVIISDALRYEVGQELFIHIQDDPKSTVKMDCILSVLPSYTKLGMAALLPHNTLTMTDDYKVLADNMLCDTLAGRQAVLQNHCENSACVQFDDIKGANKAKLRSFFTGKQVVYVYHNQIDARGDKANTEDEVFSACNEALDEIVDLIRRIALNANTYRFIVTADHGFIYKRDKLTESDKIKVKSKNAFVNRRFIVAKEPVVGDGVQNVSMGRILKNNDSKQVSFPVSSNVFKAAGGGANYVHGGSSPQEMLVPVIDIKMDRRHMETKPAQISLVSIVHKITNLVVSMDFIQTDAITDMIKEASYRLFFISENGDRISNENILAADSRESDAVKRITKMYFTLKSQKYDQGKQYYLVALDAASGLEMWRHPVIIDLTYEEDYDF